MNRNKRVGEYVAFTNEIMGKIPFNHVIGIRVELIKAYSSVAFSSAKIANGTAYDVYSGGISNGEAKDGLYSGGNYSPGTKHVSFTPSNITTAVSSRNVWR